MAITISAEKELKNIKRNLQFCYLCGQVLTSRPHRNKDHIPPSGLFAPADRSKPLILPTHCLCNGSRSKEDQTIGQLVGVLHGRRVNPNHNKLQIRVGRFNDGSRGAALEGFDLKEAIRRLVRGFHAALYGEYLSPNGSFATYTPLPEAIRQEEALVFAPVPTVLPKFVEELKRNRVVRNLDRLILWNGKCRYECV